MKLEKKNAAREFLCHLVAEGRKMNLFLWLARGDAHLARGGMHLMRAPSSLSLTRRHLTLLFQMRRRRRKTNN
jgi:hypothetical protein